MVDMTSEEKMARDKRPVELTEDPQYPKAAEAAVNRRRFFALLGAGTAGALVMGVSSRADAQRFAPPPPPRDYPDPPPVTPGLPRPPRYRQQRVPSSGSWSTHLKGDYYVAYVLWVKHDEPEIDEFLRYEASKILSSVDRILYRDMHHYYLDDPQKKWAVEGRVARKLRRMLKEYLRPGLISVNLEFVRRKFIEPLDGEVAPAPYY